MFSHRPSCLSGPVSRFGKEDELPESARTDPQIRVDLVKRIRRAIRAGRYDTPERWNAALELFLERLQIS